MDKEQIITSLKEINIDARSDSSEFDEALINLRVLPDYPGSYAKDHHYKIYGFGFINSESDSEEFLKNLDLDNDALDTSDTFKWGCTKARNIRNGMKEPWGFVDSVDQFKALASYARRVHCSCHETGSFKVR